MDSDVIRRRCVFWALTTPLLLLGCANGPTRSDAESTIVDGERAWAASVASGDVTVVERILADDFVGIDPKGRRYTKSQMVADTANGPKYFESNRLTEVKVRFFATTAVAQGSESWVRHQGDPRCGRFVWTDTWLLRDGRWQIAAAEDLTVPEECPR